MEISNEKFGKFIKELRKEKNLTQKELAEKINITDKAISKWERGLSFPDITLLNLLAKIFGVSVTELLNGEKGIKDEKNSEINIEKLIKEIEEKITRKKEKRKNIINQIKKVSIIISAILFVLFSIIQIGYLLILKRYNYEYIIDIFPYIINEIIIISGLIFYFGIFLNNKIKNNIKLHKIILIIIFVILTIINIIFMCFDGLKKCYVSFSKYFSNQVVLKTDKENGSTVFYRDAKLLIFARPKEEFSYEMEGKPKFQWLGEDVCTITYEDRDKKLREFVATFGDRGDGISYYNVSPAISGQWQTSSQYGEEINVLVDSKGITVKRGNNSKLFEYSSCKQFGTLALVLYENEIPKYIISLNKNCKLDKETYLVEKGGTITLTEVSMKKTKLNILRCVTHKEGDMTNYNIVNLSANNYAIKNGILYISYDGKKTIEVPGDFADMKYEEDEYQIAKEKTFFYYYDDGAMYFVYSDDMGENWNTTYLLDSGTIESIQFINKDIGYILEYKDVASGTAWGDIRKTTDGGKTWEEIFWRF